MRWAWAAVSLAGVLGCEEKPPAASDPLPVPKAAPLPAAVAPPPPPAHVVEKPAGVRACGWGQIHEGEGVTYRQAVEVPGGGKAARGPAGDIVQGDAHVKSETRFGLTVVSRQGDRAWALASFDGAKPPSRVPPKFLIEFHTGDAAPAAEAWSPPHDTVRPSQLTAEGVTYACDDAVVAGTRATHTCVQPPPTCLFWLDGLVRDYSYLSADERQTLELVARTAPSPADQGAPPVEPAGAHFAGIWYGRSGPHKLDALRFYVESGKLIREAQPYRLVGAAGGRVQPGMVTIDGGLWIKDGAATRDATSFRQWVLDLLTGNPVSPRFIPATSEITTTFGSFPD